MTTSLHRIHAGALSLCAALALIAPPGFAQDTVPSPAAPGGVPAGAAAGDPPGRVARLDYFNGTVTMEPAGLTDWSYAVLNRPLTTGDQLWADSGARAELHAGSTALRLDQQTALDIVDLTDTVTQLKVTQGSLSAHVRALPAGQSFEVDTPNVALVATNAGLFRVDVAPDGSATTVTLRSGTATLYGDGGSYAMSAGEQIRFVGTNLQQQAGGAAPAPDSFDRWVAARDRAEDASVSARYVSREMPGYEALDANGTWRHDPTYGEVWVPTVAVSAGWVPYHAGHWAWIAPWGWTWIDDAPWGFAPFHYGRWAYIDRVWAWVPGPVVVARPPCYAPALVAFVGGGSSGGGGVHWGINLTIGAAITAGVAWLPLGPGEPWHPAYGYSPRYYERVNNVNVTNVHNTTIVNNITNVHNTYINQTVPGAVTAVPANTFVHGQPVAMAAHALTPQQLAHAQVGAGAPAVAPVRESFAGGMRAAKIGAPAEAAQRQVIATRAPAVPPALHDTLAQRFASAGGRVEGAGEPVVHRAAPEAAHGAPASREPQTQGFHVIDRETARPVGRQPGLQTPVQGEPNGEPQEAPQHGGETARGQGAPQAPADGNSREASHEIDHEAHPGEPAPHAPAAADNGVPHPTGGASHAQEEARNGHTAQGGFDAPQAAPQAEGPRAPQAGRMQPHETAAPREPQQQPEHDAVRQQEAPRNAQPTQHAEPHAVEAPHDNPRPAQRADAAPRPAPHTNAHPAQPHAHPQPHPQSHPPAHKAEEHHG